jgi:WD40 repeat protein
MRSGRCTITLATTQGNDKQMRTCAMVSANGIPYVFTGGSDECIRVWDIRSSRYLYELSTGNTTVMDMVWHTPSSSLIACLYCDYIDRYGHGLNYGYNDNNEDADDQLGMPSHIYISTIYQYGINVIFSACVGWPSEALHDQSDFGMPFDYGRHGILSYRFDPLVPTQHDLTLPAPRPPSY